MIFNFVTLFENLITPYFQESILKIAIEKKIININTFNPRDFTKNKHLKVDDSITGGGCGMLMTAQPLFDCLSKLEDTHIIFLSPTGKTFNQKDAKVLSTKKNITFVCGRYEGIDERVIEKYADQIYSIGDYVLTGGELASLVMCDSISRNINGVLGNSLSMKEESFENNLLEYPSFSKPTIYKKIKTPNILLSGNHKKIKDFRVKMSICKTKYTKVDLYLKYKNNK
jgi:tRNA (guanine37-N1)-methyltransferase